MMSYHVKVIRVSRDTMINYCYLVYSEKYALLIDPAWEQGKIERVLADSNAHLSSILLTHHHPDHIHLSSPLAQKFAIPVYMSEAEINFYEFQCPNLRPINKFEDFWVEDIKVTPIFTPGHTKGGVSYLIGDNLFTGDTLFIEGCGICSTRGGNAGILYESLQILKARISPNILIYPGHSYGETVGKPFDYLLKNNIYLNILSKSQFISFRTRPNQRNLFSFK